MSLDQRLRDAPAIKNLVVKLLTDLASRAMSGLIIQSTFSLYLADQCCSRHVHHLAVRGRIRDIGHGQ